MLDRFLARGAYEPTWKLLVAWPFTFVVTVIPPVVVAALPFILMGWR